jgi:hypothetical protein
MKKCTKCNLEKNLLEFNKSCLYIDGRRSECRECQKLQGRIYREKNKEKINEKLRIQYRNNPSIQKSRSEKWKSENPEDYKISNYKRSKKWEEKNKEYRKIYKNNYSTERLKTDKLFNLGRNVRIRINRFMKNKSKSTENIIGITFDKLKIYLEKKFSSGMSWDNYGKWHIDHIKPLSSAKTESEIYELCHYSNLQPLWAEDNLKKGSKIL